MRPMIVSSLDENVWSITVTGRADGRITLSPVNAPIELFQLIREALAPKAPVVGSGPTA